MNGFRYNIPETTHWHSCKCGDEIEASSPDIDHERICMGCNRIGCWVNLGRICPECEEPRLDDARVEAGMKCGVCAYGSEGGQN